MRTSQEWQMVLGLEESPDAELLELLNETAGLESASFTAADAVSAGIAFELNPDALEGHIEEMFIAETVGEALCTARGVHKIGVREAARRLDVSGAQIVKIEQGCNSKVGTIGKYAEVIGFSACLTLRSQTRSGLTISVPLNLLAASKQ